MGGRAAEELLFHEVTGGAGDDFDKANRLATVMVTKWGMGRDPEAADGGTSGRGDLGFLVASSSGSMPSGVQAASTRAIRAILDDAYESAYRTLVEHVDTLRRLAAYLVEHERLDGETFSDLFEGRIDVPRATEEWRPTTSRPRAWDEVAVLADRRFPRVEPAPVAIAASQAEPEAAESTPAVAPAAAMAEASAAVAPRSPTDAWPSAAPPRRRLPRAGRGLAARPGGRDGPALSRDRETPDAPGTVPSGAMPLIALDGLTKRYGNGVTALDALTLELEPGIIGLVGANGAGKSTMLKLLLGLLEPTSGAAKVMDLDVRTHGPQVREFVGYMPEHDCLPPEASATDFVGHMAQMSGLPRTAARERTAEVLRHVGLYEERYRAIGGYSTGMKQRVKLAQALVHDPRLLLLDEPTNGLDPAGRDEMLDLVSRTGTEFGIAIVLASHLLGEIERVCTYLVAIDAGKLLQAAPLKSFTEHTGVLAVEVEEGGEQLAGALKGQGLEVVEDGRLVLVALDGERTYDLVRDAVVDLGLPLVRVEQRRHSLEDLFRDQPPEAPAA